MRIVAVNEWQNWLTGKVLEKDSHGPKVIRLQDGDLLKIFRCRRHWLLARLQPDAQRFAARASRLAALGIATPLIRECAWLEVPGRVSLCRYTPLVGTPLDSLLRRDHAAFLALVPALAAYILHLHRLGIYFRSLHPGNILLLPEGGFGLIDFLDLRFKRRPLGATLVQRNFQHLERYLTRRKVTDFPLTELRTAYQQAASH